MPDALCRTRFAGRFFREGFRPRYEWGGLLRQCCVIGGRSLTLVGSRTGFIMGLVLTRRLRQPVRTGHGPLSALSGDMAMSQQLRQTTRHAEQGTTSFGQSLEASRRGIRLRGYFRKQAKKEPGRQPAART